MTDPISVLRSCVYGIESYVGYEEPASREALAQVEALVRAARRYRAWPSSLEERNKAQDELDRALAPFAAAGVAADTEEERG